MRLIERYLFRQLLGPTLAATLALGLVALLTQTLGALDFVVDKHQSLLVFTRIIALSMPQMLSIVLPISLFVAALMTLNRLHTEQEIVVCFAGGVSRWRVVSPFLRLAVYAALFTLVVNLWVAPWAQRQRQEELFRIKTDLLTTLVREGSFTQPGEGLTFYAQSSDKAGELHNIFIDEHKADRSANTFNAETGRIEIRDGRPVMVLHSGSNQTLSKDGALNYLTFGEYVFDLSAYVNSDEDVIYKASDRFMHELFRPDLSIDNDKRNRKKYLAEAHARMASPIYDLTVMLLALSGVLGGAFSRTGYGRRIAIVAGVALVVRMLGFGAQAACDGNVGLNVLQYLVPLIPAALAFRTLFRGGRVRKAAGLGALAPLGAA